MKTNMPFWGHSSDAITLSGRTFRLPGHEERIEREREERQRKLSLEALEETLNSITKRYANDRR